MMENMQMLMIMYLLILFMYMKAPLMLSIMLCTILVLSLIMMSMNIISWIPYIMVIVVTSGIMVIFSYLASFVLNEWSMKFNWNIFMIYIYLLFVLFLENNKFTFTLTEYMSLKLLENSMYFLYSSTFGFFSTFLISYLFFMLIIVLKISSQFKVPLRLM